jgi:cytochrome c peroxidase
MAAKFVAAIGVVLAVSLTAATRHFSSTNEDDEIRAGIVRDADSFEASLVALSSALRHAKQNSDATADVRAKFADARTQFKHVEGIVEFYAPALAAAINSRRQEVDDDDAPPPSTLAPSGFPSLERYLWPTIDRTLIDSAITTADGMRPLAVRLRTMAPGLFPTEAQIIEIARFEIARVATLGIAGFDAPKTGSAIAESANALDGIRTLLQESRSRFWKGHSRELDSTTSALTRSAAYLRANPDFESFNRLAFIANYSRPAAHALDALRRAANTHPVGLPRGWRYDVGSVFDRDAFDPRVYAPVTAPTSSTQLVALGERLFKDPSLSGPRARSCATCHVPSRAFQDGAVRSNSIDPRGGRVARNTPTLLNTALQPAQFADERAVTLEDQVLAVLSSPAEMSSSAALAATRLSADSVYRASFACAFGAPQGGAVTPLRVRQALAAYVRTLIALDSRFDRAVRGDTLAMTDEERRGFTIFMGKAGCGTCHFAPLFSGNTPPRYLASDVEVIGTTASSHEHAVVDADSGRARIDGLPTHLHAFKTPSLRNSTLTAPYMHNGAFRALDDVLRFYDRGGGIGSGANVSNQTLPADSLKLSTSERRAIIAFLGTLVDTAPMTGR